jgi:hypothetical protein
MNIELIDKLDLSNKEDLIKRDRNLRIVINHKIYDTSHEDDIAKYIIQCTKFKDMLLIRYEYYLSKTYHGLGKGDMVFYSDNKLYIIELKSLKDKYSSCTDNSKINKCIKQSIKYSEYSKIWGGMSSIPVTAIEMLNGNIELIERNFTEEHLESDEEILYKEIVEDDKWFNHPGDQTLTRYKINGDTLESERIVDYHPSSGSRRSFRKRVKRICEECTKCTKYFITMKNIQNDIIYQEFHEINELIIE